MGTPNRHAIFSGVYDQIGIACGCHPTFERYCVVDLGFEVTLKDEDLMNSEDWDKEYDDYSRRNLLSWGNCEKSYASIYCTDTEFDADYVRPMDQLYTTQHMANGIFEEINLLRNDTTYYVDYLRGNNFDSEYPMLNRFARKEISRWEEEKYPAFVWSESLARAGRHVLNSQGSCETHGSHYGEYFEESLNKYYAYEYENLEWMELTSVHFGGYLNNLLA